MAKKIIVKKLEIGIIKKITDLKDEEIKHKKIGTN